MVATEYGKAALVARTRREPSRATGLTVFLTEQDYRDLTAPPTMLRMVPPPRSGEGLTRPGLRTLEKRGVRVSVLRCERHRSEANAGHAGLRGARCGNPSPERGGGTARSAVGGAGSREVRRFRRTKSANVVTSRGSSLHSPAPQPSGHRRGGWSSAALDARQRPLWK
jgi:hypothetical protein